MKQLLTLTINGESHEVWTSTNKTLLEVLREDLNLTGTKHGCELGECGACTVLIEGEPVLACLILPLEVQAQDIQTIEGLTKYGSSTAEPKPHPLQTAFAEQGASQCGYCSPGMLMTAKAFLDKNSKNHLINFLVENTFQPMHLNQFQIHLELFQVHYIILNN